MRPALITTPDTLAREFDGYKKLYQTVPLVVTSGGFDPLHVGHLRCIQAASRLTGKKGVLAVIVNGDGFLMRKKGHIFMPLSERMELISGLKGVDYVVPWDDGSQTVTECLRIIKPNIFAKGGDRTGPENVPEYDTCTEIGCTVVFGIGGVDKVQSSSALVEKVKG